MKPVVGFIGLGIMGLPQAINIHKAGFRVIGYNRSRPAVDKLVAQGGEAATTVAELAQKADIICSMLPNWPEVKQTALGEAGIEHNARPGTLFVDMSSIAPMVSKEIHDALAAKGIHMLDAPVSGGEPKAIDGTLAIMVGGAAEHLEKAMPVLKAMASTVTHIGGIGAGNVSKLCNQIIVALNIAAVGEALTFAAKAGVDPGLVFEAIRGGLAGSVVMDAKAPMMLEGNITPGGPLAYHVKDLKNVADTAFSLNMPLPLTAQVREMMQSCLADGLERADHSCLVRYHEKLANVKVRRK